MTYCHVTAQINDHLRQLDEAHARYDRIFEKKLAELTEGMESDEAQDMIYELTEESPDFLGALIGSAIDAYLGKDVNWKQFFLSQFESYALEYAEWGEE